LASLISIGESRRADIVADNQYLYDSAARIIISPAWPAALTNWELTLDDFQRGSNPYDVFNLGMLKPVVRADFLHARGLAYETRTRQGQEYFYLLQFFLSGGRAIVCDVPYYFYSQPFGSLSRTWSLAGRKRYDFPTAIALHESYLGIAARYFTPPQLRRFKKRIRRLKALAIYTTAKSLFDEGRSDDALAMLVRHPVILDYVMRRLLERIAGLSAAWTTARIAARCSRRTLRTSRGVSP
jgi:succinoglycan biosynthesis protein ExoO